MSLIRIDTHQHVWTEPLLDQLATRDGLPFVLRDDGPIVLHSVGEPPYVVNVGPQEPQLRADLVHADGVDMAFVAISSPIGIEALPRAEAVPLVESHLQGVLALPDEFAAWGPIVPDHAEADDVDALLDRGCIGISLPAGALAGPERLQRMTHVLHRAAQLDCVLFVHPGRAPGQLTDPAEFDEPTWWRPLTDYVSQMQAAWLTFAALGRREYPELKVLFAMLGGGAPLLSERLDARSGPPVDLTDPNTFYETSSYGPVAIEMMADRVGGSQLLYGSDRPVIDLQPNGYELMLQTNAGDLFAGALQARASRATV